MVSVVPGFLPGDRLVWSRGIWCTDQEKGGGVFLDTASTTGHVLMIVKCGRSVSGAFGPYAMDWTRIGSGILPRITLNVYFTQTTVLARLVGLSHLP